VAQSGDVIAEHYYNGQGPDSLYEVRSVTKSFTSALIGIAVGRGLIGSVHDRIDGYLEPDVADLDPTVGATTIEDLLTMRAGHDWHEIPGPSEFPAWVSSSNQIQYVLAKPLVNQPGTVFNYSDGAAHLAAAVLAEAAGTSVAEFATTYLFGPLGIPARPWYVDRQGFNYGGVGLHLRAQDMLAFGMLFLNEGRHDGRQIVPADWVTASTDGRISTNNAVPYGPSYGYYWWSGAYLEREFYFANGYGGQFIVVVPRVELVVVATCEWRGVGDRAGEHWYRILDTIVREVVAGM
jgi:CubicO group peptidase (beta-lactamase class C family)